MFQRHPTAALTSLKQTSAATVEATGWAAKLGGKEKGLDPRRERNEDCPAIQPVTRLYSDRATPAVSNNCAHNKRFLAELHLNFSVLSS